MKPIPQLMEHLMDRQDAFHERTLALMAIDYSGFAFPKGRVKALDKADKKLVTSVVDKMESAKAKIRAGGRCEVYENYDPGNGYTASGRCRRKDTETHHLIGGIGRRNKGKSILAEYKLRVCRKCHQSITANILKPTTAEHDASTVRFWRSR